MVRRAMSWCVVVGVTVGTTSLVTASAPAIDAAAQVRDRAQRLEPTFEPDLTPEQRPIEELVRDVNLERSSRGLPFLQLDDRASAAARAHAADMAANRVMQHAGSDGSDGGVRLTRAGYVWTAWGENIGAGFVDPHTLFESWMRSPNHRDNLMGDFTDIGVGVVATPDGVPYWAVLVARAPYVPGVF